MQSTKSIKISILCGVIGPVLFVAVFAIEGWLRPGYNPLASYISALSLGSRGWIQIVNFVVTGILLLTFARGLASKFKGENVSQTGPVLLTIIAISILFSGPFVMDPADTPRQLMSLHGTVHGILGGIVFLLMPVSCFVFFNRFKKEAQWQSFGNWTLLMAIIIALADVLFTITTKFPSVKDDFNDWLGFIQRSVLVPFMFWLFTYALKLYRLGKVDK